jgi:hypothetical protein
MRRCLLFGLIVTGISALTPSAHAQNFGIGAGIGNIAADPFSGYYSWFLPRQAAMASTPTVNNQLNQFAAERVDNYAESRRASSNVLDYATLGIGAATGQDLDDGRPRNPRPRLSSTGPVVSNYTGHGVGRYHERSGSYYPTQRASTYRNPGLPGRRR